MSDQTTRRMITAYFQDAMPTMFLASMFRTPPENFHNSEEVEIDIVRGEEDVATVITDLSTGANVNSFDAYTNKSFAPPIYDEAFVINSFDLIKRDPGFDPFQDVTYQAKATRRAFRDFRKVEAMVRRAVELQASQVLQTGTLTLRDKEGTPVYTLNFQPKATHFPTAGTTWGQSGDDKVGDINSLAQVIRNDGLGDPDMLIFGEKAWEEWISDETVLSLLDNRRVGVAEVRPEGRGEGATFQGFIWIGNYRYEMWTYSGRYKDPQTNNKLRYIDTGNVIVRDSMGRLDLTFGSIPLFERSGRVLPGLPERMVSTDNGFGMTTNSWVDASGRHAYASAGTRPLCQPTAIDTFGTLDTGLT